MEEIKINLIVKYLEGFHGVAESSVESYSQTGKISGSLLQAIKFMLDEYAQHLEERIKELEEANKTMYEQGTTYHNQRKEIEQLKKDGYFEKYQYEANINQRLHQEILDLKKENKQLHDLAAIGHQPLHKEIERLEEETKKTIELYQSDYFKLKSQAHQLADALVQVGGYMTNKLTVFDIDRLVKKVLKEFKEGESK